MFNKTKFKKIQRQKDTPSTLSSHQKQFGAVFMQLVQSLAKVHLDNSWPNHKVCKKKSNIVVCIAIYTVCQDCCLSRD